MKVTGRSTKTVLFLYWIAVMWTEAKKVTAGKLDILLQENLDRPSYQTRSNTFVKNFYQRKKRETGLYCFKRRELNAGTSTPCCLGRNDECAVEFFGTMCYCDQFCYRNVNSDCCPDYLLYCVDYTLQTEFAYLSTLFTTDTPSFTTKPQINAKEETSPSIPIPTTETELPFYDAVCFYEGVGYKEGEITIRNCNKCVCELSEQGYYQFHCGSDRCLIRPNIVEAINQGKYGWLASSYSFLWGLTLLEGYKYRLGTAKPSKILRNMYTIEYGEKTKDLPGEFDARNKWPNSILPPRDQKNCGSSWAFSTTSVASDRMSIQFKGNKQIDLSPQQLLSCRSHSGCSEGSVDHAWWYLRKRGVVPSSCYPYFGEGFNKSGSCLISQLHQKQICPSGVIETPQFYKTGPAYRISDNEADIMEEIFHNGPLQVSIKIHPDFFLYKSGVYSPTPVDNVIDKDLEHFSYHSVKMIGWGTQEDPIGKQQTFWLLQNSWGKNWGENGYFKIRRGSNEIEKLLLAAWPKSENFLFK